MKENRLIIRAFGIFMSIFMLTAVLSKSLLGTQVLTDVSISTDQNSDDSDEEETYFSELSSEVVIPSNAFSFNSDLVFLLSPTVKFLPLSDVVSNFIKPIFKHSYFDKLFELHIAINAP
ncbi:hypothetical protein [uncultured Arcticibacterium sp.]|uniref:hypothetical protein n=1 Tax=uncultured Arcticibacterium sp. TaxID=2173042 RepID=UPI0030F6D25B